MGDDVHHIFFATVQKQAVQDAGPDVASCTSMSQKKPLLHFLHELLSAASVSTAASTQNLLCPFPITAGHTHDMQHTSL